MSELEIVQVSNSEVVTEIAYDGDTIYVTTKRGDKYPFPHQDSNTWEMFKRAESKGKFFNQLRRSVK